MEVQLKLFSPSAKTKVSFLSLIQSIGRFSDPGGYGAEHSPSSSALLNLAPWLRKWKIPNHCHSKKRDENSPLSCLEFLGNDTTENWIKSVAIDMQMLQSFTAPGQRWLHFHVGFAHKYVDYLSAPASTKMIAADVQTEQAKSTNKWRLVEQALPFPCFWFVFPSGTHKAQAKQDPSGCMCGRPIWFSPKVTAAGFSLRDVTAITWWEPRLEPGHARDGSIPAAHQSEGCCQRKGHPRRGSTAVKENLLNSSCCPTLNTNVVVLILLD